MPAQNGEDRLVEALLARLPKVGRGRGVHTGAGDDDCAVVQPSKGNTWQLLKTDCVIEGVHFASDAAPDQVGWKALCRPLSDIAATGGKPRFALVTMALNRVTAFSWAAEVYTGIARAAEEFGVQVVGGETASTPGPSFLSVCLTGTVKSGRCITRGGGRIDDVLYVTGRLGGSLPSGRHLNFRPRLAEGRWLAAHFPIRAMMDLSDGLAADLPRLARASGTGFIVQNEQLPLANGCSIEQALGDGEDYELLFAIGSRHAPRLEKKWRRRFPSLPLTAIGRLSEPDQADDFAGTGGYDHFATLDDQLSIVT